MYIYTTVKHLLITTLLKQLPEFVSKFALIFAVMTVALVGYNSTIVLTCR